MKIQGGRVHAIAMERRPSAIDPSAMTPDAASATNLRRQVGMGENLLKYPPLSGVSICPRGGGTGEVARATP